MRMQSITAAYSANDPDEVLVCDGLVAVPVAATDAAITSCMLAAVTC